MLLSSHLVTGAFSPERSRNFGSFADFVLSVLRKVHKNAMLFPHHFWWRFRKKRPVRAAYWCFAGCRSSFGHSVVSGLLQVSQQVPPCLIVVLFFCTWFCSDLATGLPVLGGVYGYFVCLLGSAQNYLALSPAIQMVRRYFPRWNWKNRWTSPEQRWAHSLPCCVKFSRFFFFLKKVLTTNSLSGISVIFTECSKR